MSQPGPPQQLSASYAVATAAIGRFTVNVTSPSADTWVLYVIDANSAVAMSTVNTFPVIIYAAH